MKYRSRMIPLVLSLSFAAVLLLGSAVPQPAGMAMDIPEQQDPGISSLDDSPPPLPTDGKDKADDLGNGTEVPFTQSDPKRIEYTIPKIGFPTEELKHIVSPVDLSGQSSAIQSAAAPDGWTTIMTEDFEWVFPSPGWTVFDSDGATNGEYFWDDVSYRFHNGGWSAWPANGGADRITPPANYPNNMDSWMVYGPFDLSDAVDVEMLFSYWLSCEVDYDWFFFGISDDGTNFTGIFKDGSTGGWVSSAVYFPEWLGDGTVWFAFVFSSDASNTDEGVYVDDILLRKDVAPDLQTITPPDWDQSLVPSSVTGTHTVGTLYTYQDTYIDWAVANNSSVDASGRFYSCLYFDSIEVQCWATDDLGAFLLDTVSDWILNLTPTAGWHNLTFVADAYDDFLEPNELDNSWSENFYWHPNANLTPYTQGSWDYPLVPSSLASTNSVNDLYTFQTTYIDWTIKNWGPDNILAQFDTCLYLDDVELNCWFSNGKIAGNIASIEDWVLNMTPSPGLHNLKIVTDVNDDIAESDETDNAWSMDFYWHPDANLTPYKPGSWTNPIVPSTLTGTNTVNDLYVHLDTYIDWAVINSGPENIIAQFETCLYLDNVDVNCWYTSGKIAGNIAYIEDWILDVTPSPGLHNLKIVTDVNDDVAESDETDNMWSMDLYWHPDANLTPYKPGSWTNPIVPSTLTGTNTVNDLYVHLDTYIDWAVINSGPEDIIAQFDTCFYLDNVELNCWNNNGKIAGNIASIEDWVLNLIPAPGWHNLKIVTDAYDDVNETNETDNTWAADFYWNPSPNADIYITPSSLTSQQTQDQVMTLNLDIHNYGSAPLDWSIYEAPTGSCSAADIPWVSVSPDSGTTAPASTIPIDVVFDSTGLAAGTYQVVLCFSSNDPDKPLISVPITLETIEELTIFLPMLFRP